GRVQRVEEGACGLADDLVLRDGRRGCGACVLALGLSAATVGRRSGSVAHRRLRLSRVWVLGVLWGMRPCGRVSMLVNQHSEAPFSLCPVMRYLQVIASPDLVTAAVLRVAGAAGRTVRSRRSGVAGRRPRWGDDRVVREGASTGPSPSRA